MTPPGDERVGGARVEFEIDDSPLRQQLDRLEGDIRAKLAVINSMHADPKVELDTGKVKAQLTGLLGSLGVLEKKRSLKLSVEEAEAALDRFAARAGAVDPGHLQLTLDTAKAQAELDAALAEIDRKTANVKIAFDVDRGKMQRDLLKLRNELLEAQLYEDAESVSAISDLIKLQQIEINNADRQISKTRELNNIAQLRADTEAKRAKAEELASASEDKARERDNNLGLEALRTAQERVNLEKKVSESASKVKEGDSVEARASVINAALIRTQYEKEFGTLEIPTDLEGPKAGAVAKILAEYHTAIGTATGGGGLRIPLPRVLGGGFNLGGGGNADQGNWQKLLWGRGTFGLAGLGTVGAFAGLSADRLLFTALSVLGSAGAGALGGGLLGAGALGNIAVGGGSDLAVLKSTISDTKQLGEQAAKTSKAEEVFGKGSKEAVRFRQEGKVLEKELAGGPKTEGVKAEKALAEQANALNHFWDQQTQKARVSATKILEQTVDLGHRYVPLVANAARQNLNIIDKDIKPLFAFLESKTGGVKIFGDLERQFKSILPTSIHAFTQAIELMLKTIDVASRYTGGFVQKLDAFFTKWNSPEFFTKWESNIGKLIGDFKLWAHFIDLIGKDLAGLFKNDAGLGNGIIQTLTGMLEHVKAYEESVSGKDQLKNIFLVHKEEVITLLKLLPLVLDPLGKLYLTFAPVAVKFFTTFVEGLTDVVKGIEALGKTATFTLGGFLLFWKLGFFSPIALVKSSLKVLLQELAKATAARLEASSLPGTSKLAKVFAGAGTPEGTKFGEVAAERLIAAAPEIGNIIAARMAGGSLGPSGGPGGALKPAEKGAPLSFGAQLLGRGIAGLSVGLGGLIASEVVGQLIGGKTGSTVSGIGNSAAIGAAIGTVIAPGIGTAIGGALGAGFAGIKDLFGPSGSLAKVSPTSPNITKKVEHEQAKEIDAYEKKYGETVASKQGALEILKFEHAAKYFYAYREAAAQTGATNEQLGKSLAGVSISFQQAQIGVQRAREELAHTKAGTLEHKEAVLALRGAMTQAREAEEAWNKVRHESESQADIEVFQSKEELQFAEKNVEFRQKKIVELEEEGKATAKATEERNAAERSLDEARRKRGESEARQAAVPLNIKRGEQGFAPVLGKGEVALGSLVKKPQTEQLALKIAYTIEDPNKAAAVAKAAFEAVAAKVNPHVLVKVLADTKDADAQVAAFKALALGVPPSTVFKVFADTKDARVQIKAFEDLAKGVPPSKIFKILADTKDAKEKLKELENLGKTAGHNAAANFTKSFNLVPGILAAFGQAEVAVATGLNKINSQMTTALKKAGLSPKEVASFSLAPQGGFGPGPAATHLQESKATGGYVQFGQTGARGHDKIPAHLMVGSGEVGAVFTHHQQKVANSYLAPIGGLPGLFNKVNQPHYMASGGAVGGADALARMISEANSISAAHFPYLWGGGHGNFNGPYDCSGAVSAVLHAGNLLKAPRVAGEFENFGQPGPGRVTLYVNDNTHVYMSLDGKFFGTSLSNPGGGAAWFAGGPRPGFMERHVPEDLFGAGSSLISTPKVSGVSGALGAISQGVLGTITKGANKAVQTALASVFGGKFNGGNAGEERVSGGHYSRKQLEYLWDQAGGPTSNSRLMGAIALAESAGDPNAHNASGASGLWQILGLPFPGNVFDPLTNARMAVSKFRSQGLQAWETYTNGAYRQFFARGGLYKKPALLVGEHGHEYVINPKLPQNAEYLKQAGHEMGYHVTPAGGGKPVGKILEKKGDFIPSVDFAQKGSVPPEAVDPMIADFKKALRTEESNKRSALKEKDTILRQLAKSKDATAKAIYFASRKSALAVKNAQGSLNVAQAGLAEAQRNPLTEDVALAKSHVVKAAHGVTNAQHNATLEQQKIAATGSAKIKDLSKRLKNAEETIQKIEKGGLSKAQHITYEPLKKLRDDVKKGEKFQQALKNSERHVKALNKEITDETHQMNTYAREYKLHGVDKAGIKHKWEALFKEREGKIGDLEKYRKDALVGAKHFQDEYGKKIDIHGFVEQAEAEDQSAKDEGLSSREEAEAGVSGEGQTATSFLGPAGTERVEKLEEKLALAETQLVPDNPYTPKDEELPGLEAEFGPAKQLMEFWTEELSAAQAAKEPASIIKEIAGDVTAARSRFFGLEESIRQGKERHLSQENQEVLAYSTAREELYKTYGSNFAPIPPSPNVRALLAQSQSGILPSAPTPQQGNVTHVNVTNNFAEGPANTHHWANGLAWELEAAV